MSRFLEYLSSNEIWMPQLIAVGAIVGLGVLLGTIFIVGLHFRRQWGPATHDTRSRSAKRYIHEITENDR